MAFGLNGDMYALSLPHEIRIERTDNDSCVLGLFLVEMDEVLVIKGLSVNKPLRDRAGI
jgi:hypothetical protein